MFFLKKKSLVVNIATCQCKKVNYHIHREKLSKALVLQVETN